MKYRNVLKSVILGLAVLALATLPPSASASTVGELSIANCSGVGGGVTVTITAIDWLPDGGAANNCLAAGIPTKVTSGLGSINSSSIGTINDLNSLPLGNTTGFAGFMTFGAIKLDLIAVGPGLMDSCVTNPGIGNSCSIPLPGDGISPFVLTQDDGGTSVSLSAYGTTLDTTDNVLSYWNGAFTTQLNTSVLNGDMSPAGIQARILGHDGIPPGSVTSTYSGTFDITVPEPVSMALIGGGLIALASIRQRKRA